MEIELRQARTTFITECRELLEAMEASLLVLEKTPDDPDTINSLFRSAHTIKGSSGIVGVETVEKFTHVMENLLSRVRENEIRIDNRIIELLLECRDHIASLVDLAESEKEGLPEELAGRGSALTARLNAYLGVTAKEGPVKVKAPQAEEAQGQTGRLADNENWHISLRFGPDVLKNGMDPASFLSYLSRLGEVLNVATLWEGMPGPDKMDPECCYLGFEIEFRSEFDKKTIEDVFEFVREDCRISILPPHSRIESYRELIDGLPEEGLMLGELLVKGGALTKTELDEALLLQQDASGPEGKTRKIGEILVNEGMVHPETLDAALEKQKTSHAVKAREASTIRIDANKLDSLINLVGELVISSANINQHAQRIRDGWLVESASIMSRLVENIRDNAMKIRMVPIGETFSRFNRVVRDVGREVGKDIELIISGGETELDKTVVEKINDPLMHLVRNSADHGIETPAERGAAGKAAKGTISLNAYHDAGSIVIEIRDDGRGLNRQKILEKAVRQGLVAQGQTLTDPEVYGLIFEPGFSTAEQVTKLSGRGVGMDVVRRNIEALRGTVEVDTKEGSWTIVRIRLPLTLAIIDGFMVGVSGSNYVIPLETVVECLALPESEKGGRGGSSYIKLRGEVLPYIRIREFFMEEGGGAGFENIVIVQYAGQKIGLVVDELFGEVQTVIKSLSKVYKDLRGISGATIMGNGKVALILDIPRLIQSIELEAAV